MWELPANEALASKLHAGLATRRDEDPPIRAVSWVQGERTVRPCRESTQKLLPAASCINKKTLSKQASPSGRRACRCTQEGTDTSRSPLEESRRGACLSTAPRRASRARANSIVGDGCRCSELSGNGWELARKDGRSDTAPAKCWPGSRLLLAASRDLALVRCLRLRLPQRAPANSERNTSNTNGSPKLAILSSFLQFCYLSSNE
jgi:hypothetical protein